MTENKRKILLFNLSEQILNVSILTDNDGILKVEASVDSGLGVKDFEDRMTRYVRSKIIRKYCITTVPGLIPTLRLLSREAIRQFSILPEARISMQFIYPGLPDLVVTRTEFEEECVSLFLKALNVVIVALRQTNMIYEVYMTHQANMAHQANMTHKVFDEIILSGFAVHIPVFKQVFKLFFGQPDPTTESDKLFKYHSVIQTFKAPKHKQEIRTFANAIQPIQHIQRIQALKMMENELEESRSSTNVSCCRVLIFICFIGLMICIPLVVWKFFIK